MLLALLRRSQVRYRTRMAYVAPVVLIFGALAIPAAASPDRLVVDRSPGRYSCAGDTPSVCLATSTSRSLPSLTRQLDRLSRPLVQAGAPVPTVFRQVVPGQASSKTDAPLFLESAGINSTTVTAKLVADYLTVPRACAALTSTTPPPAEYFAVRSLLASWLLLRIGEVDLDHLTRDESYPWLALAADRQAGWVRRSYAQLSSCDLAAVRLPR